MENETIENYPHPFINMVTVLLSSNKMSRTLFEAWRNGTRCTTEAIEAR